MSAPAARKYFTIEEANHTLPLVRAIAADVVRQYREIAERTERLKGIHDSRKGRERRGSDPYSEEVAQIEQDLERDVEVLQDYIGELEKLGVELKDLGRGLIDFLARMDGRDVYLCWQLGEDEVTHWHELDAGFSGRQSLLAGSAAPDAGGKSTSGGD